MVRKITVEDTLDMSPQERLELAQEIWDSVADSPAGPPAMSDDERAELECRLEAHLRNPHDTIPWEQVKKQVLGDL